MPWQRNLATTTAFQEQTYNNYIKKIKLVQQAHIYRERLGFGGYGLKQTLSRETFTFHYILNCRLWDDFIISKIYISVAI